MNTVREINDLQTLQKHRQAWDALLPLTPGASFFHSLDWLETYWSHFGALRRWRVLLDYSGADCVGILPLIIFVKYLYLLGYTLI